MLNLACTDCYDRGFRKGHYYLLVGDTRSGKTWLALTLLAEAARNPGFKNHRLIHDDVESGALMNVSRFFGGQLKDRIEPPACEKDGSPKCSHTIEEFYWNLDDVVNEGRPFIYVLDSHDGLDSEFAQSKFYQQKEAAQSGDDAAGSFGDGKAKINSGALRRYCSRLPKTGSILVIINQTRDRLAAGGRAYGKTTAGGWALHFYATHELWTSIQEDITKKVNGVDRAQGVLVRTRVKKNRQTGKDRTVVFPIYNSYGIDDLGSCVDFLVKEKHWKTTGKGTIEASEFGFSGRKETLIKRIEDGNEELRLRIITQTVWRSIESSLVVPRKPRYT